MVGGLEFFSCVLSIRLKDVVHRDSVRAECVCAIMGKGQRVNCCFPPFSRDSNELGWWQRIVVAAIACAAVVGLFVAMQWSLISCRDHARLDSTICIVPIAARFAAAAAAPPNASAATPPPPRNVVMPPATTSAKGVSLPLPTTSPRVTTAQTPGSAAPGSAAPSGAAASLKWATYTGFTLPYYVVSALIMGSALQFLVSALAVTVFVFVNGRRFPKILRPWIDVIWLVVGSLVKYLALLVIAQTALLVPAMYVGKPVATPFAYGLAALPLSWMVWSLIIRSVQARVARRAKANVKAVSVGFQLEADERAPAIASARSSEHSSSTQQANRGMLSAKWCLMAIIGFTMLLLVRGADDYLNFVPAVPYIAAILVAVLAAFLWVCGDALLSMVCESTQSQIEKPRKRFGIFCVQSMLQSLVFALVGVLFLLFIYLPHMKEHGFFFDTLEATSNDVTQLSGVAGTLTVALLWMVAATMQVAVYKYLHGVAWIFALNVGLLVLVPVGLQNFDLSSASAILVCALCWVISNNLYAVSSALQPLMPRIDSTYQTLGAAEVELDALDDDNSITANIKRRDGYTSEGGGNITEAIDSDAADSTPVTGNFGGGGARKTRR